MMAAPHVEVIVQLGGEHVVAGQLWAHTQGRRETATFMYTPDYVRHPDAYPLDPILPLVAGPLQTPVGKPMFNAFSDSAPDRWGRKLLQRAANPPGTVARRSLNEVNYLLGVRDELRQGAIRFRDPSTGDFLADDVSGVPRLVALPRLLSAADRIDSEDAVDEAIRDLVMAGGSLGGARPKAAVVNQQNRLCIAKFPRTGSDEWDVMAWERVTLMLAERAGVWVPPSELIDVAGRKVLIVERFDRTKHHRVGFVSALTLLEASDGDQRSYLELAEVLERDSPEPTRDLRQLWRRIVFSILVSNTDDHLRNHAALRSRRGWQLSPAYDLNPSPEPEPRRLTTAIDLDNDAADIELALSVSEYFRLALDEAHAAVAEVEVATRAWRDVAHQVGIRDAEISRMVDAFESEQRRVAQSVG
jgi:serine/threonine-protein kinase HipA